MADRLTGLIAATYTPMKNDGSLNLEQVPRMVDQLSAEGTSGLYVCGSTGEGMSLSGEERRRATEAFVRAAEGRMPVVVQVGHNSLAEARELASHAQTIGADAVSATSPSYFKPGSVEILVDCMAEIAAGAPELPFYYYHIPMLTGAEMDMVEFLRSGARKIPNLVGLKYTNPTVHELQACLESEGGRHDILWGVDEMLLSALCVGVRGAVGSTYNIAAPLYVRLLEAWREGRLEEARRLQALSVAMIRHLACFPFHPAMKAVMGMIGLDCGRCRLPHPKLSDGERDRIRKGLEKMGFFDWARRVPEAPAPSPGET
jgi:N-acetylneuraminate lyase